MISKPADVPDDYIAYNPSAIYTVEDSGGARDVMYVRVEPNRSNAISSHLGRSVVRPYIVDPRHPRVPLTPFYGADEFAGEDAALTRVNRKLPSGKLEKIWLLSYIDPKPDPSHPNRVMSLYTRFMAGPNLNNLEHIADGPEGMKDICLVQADGPLGTELELYGRPQPLPDSGNITHVTIARIEDLTAETIAAAPFIDENLLPIGKGVWGGTKFAVKISAGKYILAAHRAWRTGSGGRGRHYEAVLFGHDVRANRIVELGVIATSDMFPMSEAKQESGVNLNDVVFTGGGYNDTLDFMTFGVRDSGIGIGGLRRD
jgi:hypothetical protein